MSHTPFYLGIEEVPGNECCTNNPDVPRSKGWTSNSDGPTSDDPTSDGPRPRWRNLDIGSVTIGIDFGMTCTSVAIQLGSHCRDIWATETWPHIKHIQHIAHEAPVSALKYYNNTHLHKDFCTEAQNLTALKRKMWDSEQLAWHFLENSLNEKPPALHESLISRNIPMTWPFHYRRAEATSANLAAALDHFFETWLQSPPARDPAAAGERAFEAFIRSPLHICAAQGFEELAKIYLEMGHDPDILAFPDGQSALHLAGASGHINLMRLLLARGADIEKKTTLTGRTSLLLAAFRGQAKAIDILLESGADINARDNRGQGALDLALANGYDNIVATLAGAKLETLSLEREAAKTRWYRLPNKPQGLAKTVHCTACGYCCHEPRGHCNFEGVDEDWVSINCAECGHTQCAQCPCQD